MPLVRDVDEACALLRTLGAPPPLVTHGRLVAEAAADLLAALEPFGVDLDQGLVLAGAVLHDAGKILHPGELHEPGARHEAAGETLLLANGVDATLARCCISHAQWRKLDCSLDELLVALADALWKGVRREDLEAKVIDTIATATKRDRWETMIALDDAFERIAEEGPSRLARSRLIK